MSRYARAPITPGDFSRNQVAAKAQALREAAAEWTGSMKDTVRRGFLKAGYETDTYVRRHPGRVIAGACLLGLVAGWCIGRAFARRK